MAEGRLPRDMLVGHAVQAVEETTVRFLQLPQDFGERHVAFLFRHLCIEAIDAAEPGISRWPASREDEPILPLVNATYSLHLTIFLVQMRTIESGKQSFSDSRESEKSRIGSLHTKGEF